MRPAVIAYFLLVLESVIPAAQTSQLIRGELTSEGDETALQGHNSQSATYNEWPRNTGKPDWGKPDCSQVFTNCTVMALCCRRTGSSLDCSHSKLRNMSCIPHDVLSLDLSHSTREVLLNREFYPVHQLVNLTITYSQIETIQQLAMDGLPHLLSLDLSHNPIRSVYWNLFKTLNSLTELRLCTCHLKTLADDLLWSIPQLKLLDISNNTFGDIPEHFFSNSSALASLNVSNNPDLKSLSPLLDEENIFKPLTYLYYIHSKLVNFSINCNFNVINLDLSWNQLELSPSLFPCENYTALETLNLDGNDQHSRQLPEFVFSRLPNLRKLSIKRCNFVTIGERAFHGLYNLDSLSTSQNTLLYVPQFSHSDIPTVVPKLKVYETSNSSIIRLPRHLEGMESVQTLILKKNSIQIVHNNVFSKMPSLRHLDLSENLLYSIDRYAFVGLFSLEHLDMAGCHYVFRGDEAMGYHLRGLTTLHLEDNSLQNADTDNRLSSIFEKMFNLEELHLEYTKLSNLPENMFSRMPNLTILNLSRNEIYQLPAGIFSKPPLKILNINNNYIRTLAKEVLSSISDTLTEFRAHENEYTCDCYLAWFTDWLAANSNLTTEPKEYKCFAPSKLRGQRLLSYHPGFLQCTPIIPIASGSIGFIIIMGVLLIIYRKRWMLRYRWYLFNVSRLKAKKQKDLAIHYEYDALLSHSGFDEEWAMEFVSELEKDGEIKINFPMRDFSPCGQVSSMMADSIDISRRTIVALSRNYVKNEWCKFLPLVGNSQRMSNHRDFLVLVMLEPVPFEEMPNLLRLLVKDKDFLEWTPHVHGQQLFYQQMKDILLNASFI